MDQQKFIELIQKAESISDSDKERYIQAVEKGEPLAPEMAQELEKIFAKESAMQTAKAGELHGELLEQQEKRDKEFERVKPEMDQIVAEAEEEMTNEQRKHKEELQTIEQNLETEAKGEVEAEDEAQADEIRKNLGL